MNYTDNLLETILGGDTVGALSKSSGAKQSQVESLIGAALPLMPKTIRQQSGNEFSPILGLPLTAAALKTLICCYESCRPFARVGHAI